MLNCCKSSSALSSLGLSTANHQPLVMIAVVGRMQWGPTSPLLSGRLLITVCMLRNSRREVPWRGQVAKMHIRVRSLLLPDRPL